MGLGILIVNSALISSTAAKTTLQKIYSLILYSKQRQRKVFFFAKCSKSGRTRPPQSQSGAIFFHLNHHCVVLKSARQYSKNFTGKYEKYASDHAFGTSLKKNWPIYDYLELINLPKIPGIGELFEMSSH